MSADEGAALTTVAYANLILYEDTHVQYQNGFVSDDKWIGTRENLKRGLWDKRGGPALRAVFESTSSTWSPSFRDLVGQLIAEIDDEGLGQSARKPTER